jgi:hypothetical protein
MSHSYSMVIFIASKKVLIPAVLVAVAVGLITWGYPQQ